MLSTAQLRTVSLALDALSSVHTGNDNEEGYWRRIMLAAEELAGASTAANDNKHGYMLRTAKAFETMNGGSGAEENENYEGLVERIADALELDVGAQAGDGANRVTVGAGLWQGPGYIFDAEANASVGFVRPVNTITKTAGAAAYDARAQSRKVMPANFVARLQTSVDDAQFAVGWGSAAVTAVAGFEWYVELDTTTLYIQSFAKGSTTYGHGLLDTTRLRVFVRRLAGEWTVWTNVDSDDFATATLRFTYADNAIDNDPFYATALLYTPGMAMTVAIS